MRKLLILLVILLLINSKTNLAAMSDQQALKKVRLQWGLKAGIGSVRHGLDSNWSRMITLLSPHCKDEITTLGQGSNTWENAFEDVAARVLEGKSNFGGPFKGAVNFSLDYPNYGGVASTQLWLDGIPYTDITVSVGADPSTSHGIVVINNVDTTLLGFGMHVFCNVTSDMYGTVVRRSPAIFQVNQTIAENPSQILPEIASEIGVPEFTKWNK